MKPVDQNTFDELRSNAERLFTEMKVRLDKADQKLLATEKKIKELEKFIASLAEEAAWFLKEKKNRQEIYSVCRVGRTW